MTIAPIVKTVVVAVPPSRAFELFAGSMGLWWPLGMTVGKAPHVAITIEPQIGGRWYEVDAAGNETRWGTVLAWEPPTRLLLDWQLNDQFAYDPDLHTTVEMCFVATDAGGTLVTLEHRNLEQFGHDAAAHAAKLNNGWPGMVAKFAAYADAHQ